MQRTSPDASRQWLTRTGSGHRAAGGAPRPLTTLPSESRDSPPARRARLHNPRVDERLPWGTTRDGQLTGPAKVVAGVLGTISVMACFPLGIAGIVLSSMGLDRVTTDPVRARRYLTTSWWLLGVAPTLVVVVVVGSVLTA